MTTIDLPRSVPEDGTLAFPPDYAATVVPIRAETGRRQAVARWSSLLGSDARVLDLLDHRLGSPFAFDPADLSENERAAGWGDRLAYYAAEVAADWAAGSPMRTLRDVAWLGARLVDCEDCGARAHRAQCAPHDGYHLCRFIRAQGRGLITTEELVAVIAAALRLQGGKGRMLFRVRTLITLGALKQAALQVQGEDFSAGLLYRGVASEIQRYIPEDAPDAHQEAEREESRRLHSVS